MDVKDKKPNIIAIIGAVILLVLAVVGLSYAFFSAYIKGSETDTTIEGTGAKLSLIYTDGKSIITASNIMPGWSATKTFTVTNDGEADTYYKLKISNITNAFVDGGLTFSIASSDGGTSVTEQAVGTTTRTITNSIAIVQGKTHTYTVTAKYINLSKDQTSDLGKSFSYTIGIEASRESESTLVNKILSDNEIKDPATTPGKSVSSSSEALLASTEDDYGTSYYFRGAVKNNYVQFANKCWRIVRITGDKSVKLILHNDNTSGATNPCSSANNSTNAAFAKYSGTTYTSAFNTSFSDNAYIGFMYGTVGSSSYNVTHANNNKSTVLTNLETWYENNLSSYEKYLADTIWCNDKSIFSGNGYGTNTTYYDTYNRLNTTKVPTLICNTNNNLSRFTVSDTSTGNGALKYKIGLLTADEVTFAGYMNNTNNNTVYLQENATASKWWTLSPDYITGSSVRIWSVSGSIGYLNYDISSSTSGLRPSISLTSSVEVDGTGTSEDPYVVK